ncbi:spermatogenesis-associated protein 1-like [Penaeus vannamei]|uniref:spermatogenesis-associated protein 1-like n=1 Tax=Penaeus vannamei TaxID=6689 RepID=UPI00387F58FD
MPRRIDQIRAEELRPTRTPSDLLAELHVYILPQDKWIPFRRLARNQVVEDTISAGFVRVLPDVTLHDLRQEFQGQLGEDIPDNYVFIKSVGRNFTQSNNDYICSASVGALLFSRHRGTPTEK